MPLLYGLYGIFASKWQKYLRFIQKRIFQGFSSWEKNGKTFGEICAMMALLEKDKSPQVQNAKRKVQNDVIVGATIGRPPVQHCATETDERCSPLQATY